MNDNVAMLQQMLRKRPPPPGERCDFCSTQIEPEHSHLVELAARRILCVCRPCHIVFEPKGAALGKYRPVPSRYRAIADFALDDGQWDALQVPAGLAFFFYNSLEDKMICFYPSPAGATESLLPLDTWDDLAARYPDFATLEPDVEAIVVERTGGRSRAFIVPIDAAYELVGLIRTSWKGFDGGAEAHRRIAAYFENAGARAAGKTTARIS
jgi:hypothetical protein